MQVRCFCRKQDGVMVIFIEKIICFIGGLMVNILMAELIMGHIMALLQGVVVIPSVSFKTTNS